MRNLKGLLGPQLRGLFIQQTFVTVAESFNAFYETPSGFGKSDPWNTPENAFGIHFGGLFAILMRVKRWW